MFVFLPRGVLSPDVVLEVLSMHQGLIAAGEFAVEEKVYWVSFVAFISNPQGRCSMILFDVVYELGC